MVVSQFASYEAQEEAGFDGQDFYVGAGDPTDRTHGVERLIKFDALGNPPTVAATWSGEVRSFAYTSVLQVTPGPNGHVYGFGLEPPSVKWTLVSVPKGGLSEEGGLPTVVAPGLDNPSYVLSSDGSTLFLAASTPTDSGTPTSTDVFRVDTSTNTMQKILTTEESSFLMAADSSRIYWLGRAGVGTGELWSAAADGRDAARIGTSGAVTEVAVDATSLYYTTYDGDVFKTAKPGGGAMAGAADSGGVGRTSAGRADGASGMP